MKVRLECPYRCIAEIVRYLKPVPALVDISLKLEKGGGFPLFHQAEENKIDCRIEAIAAADIVVFKQGKSNGNLVNDKGRVQSTPFTRFTTPYKGLGTGAELEVHILVLPFTLEKNLHTAVRMDSLVMLSTHAPELRLLNGITQMEEPSLMTKPY
jgi:hypothetical protein